MITQAIDGAVSETVEGQELKAETKPAPSGFRTWHAVAFLVLVLFFGGLVYFGGGLHGKIPGGAVAETGPFEKAHKEFSGQPPLDDVRTIMSAVLSGFGIEESEANILTATDTLLLTGREYAVPEMEILYCMESRKGDFKGLRNFERIATGCGFLVQTLGPGAGT